MNPREFNDFIDTFRSRHGFMVDKGGEVKMLVTKSIIRWVTPAGHYDHPAQGFTIEGSQVDDDFTPFNGLPPRPASHFRLRWDNSVFEMLRSASLCSDVVELALMIDSRGKKRFRFQFTNAELYRFVLYAIEEPPQQQ